MTADSLKGNIGYIKEITREIYVFTNQLTVIRNLENKGNVAINTDEKKLLETTISALVNQLKIINNSIPVIVEGIGFYKKLESEKIGDKSVSQKNIKEKLVEVNYKPLKSEEKISLIINDKDRKEFLENLSKSNLSINQLKRKYSIERPVPQFGKPNAYAKISNKFFRDISGNIISKGYFEKLNSDLRKMNSTFVLGTYVSMTLFTMLISLILSIFLVIFLLFFNFSLTIPFLSVMKESILIRLLQTFWLIIAIPSTVGFFMYIYPGSEARSLGSKINQELPFVSVHMSAIATSGIEPVSIFKIILESREYRYTNLEFRRLINLVNFHGKDIVTALKIVARSSPSNKLKELLEGLATTITSGGRLHEFLDKHADSLLFDYKLERERYTKMSETLMDIYISIVIAAPMVLLMLFVIIGSTGGFISFLGLSTASLSLVINLVIVVLNLGFLMFLRIQQPTF
jgi:hypothetical protein